MKTSNLWQWVPYWSHESKENEEDKFFPDPFYSSLSLSTLCIMRQVSKSCHRQVRNEERIHLIEIIVKEASSRLSKDSKESRIATWLAANAKYKFYIAGYSNLLLAGTTLEKVSVIKNALMGGYYYWVKKDKQTTMQYAREGADIVEKIFNKMKFFQVDVNWTTHSKENSLEFTEISPASEVKEGDDFNQISIEFLESIPEIQSVSIYNRYHADESTENLKKKLQNVFVKALEEIRLCIPKDFYLLQ